MRTQTTLPPAAAVAEAAQTACIFGYPLVLMERARGVMSGVPAPHPGTMQAPLNQFVHAPAGGDVNDTLRSSAWLDLVPEPVVLSVPPTYGRYYVVSLLDMWTDVFASVGPRTTGTGPGAFAICGPGWNAGTLPVGVMPLDAPTSAVRLALQVHADGDSAEATSAVQARFDLRPLSRWRRPHHTPAPDLSPAPSVSGLARDQVDGMDGCTFLGELSRLLDRHVTSAEQHTPLRAAARIGLLSGAAGWERLDGERREAAEAGVQRGLAGVRATAESLLDETCGQWRMGYSTGRHGPDYQRRAAAAYAGALDAPATDELRARLRTDADGGALSGRHRYLLRFGPDELPPVRAFWSLSARATRSGESRCYSIGNPDGLALERDGSLPIHIQREPPSEILAPNWLRTPPGGFDVTLRLFWPMDEALERRWSPPAVIRVA